MTADVESALKALALGDRDQATLLADEVAAARPDDLLASALRDHLARPSSDVYTDPEAFQRFIDGGGNVALYERAGRALAGVHAERRPETVLDLGCGDGRLTSASLRAGVTAVDLVEPSDAMLEVATRRLSDTGLTVSAHESGAEAFLAEQPDRNWDLAQSTFALHTIEPETRREVLRHLARRAGSLIVVEFDVPEMVDRSDDHIAYLAQRYRVGLAEYADEPLVAPGFLLPVLTGQLSPGAERHTWEQPVERWEAGLLSAGFATVTSRLVSDYWWAPAYLIEAQP